MASSLILHKRISTTLAKAKALRTFVEPLITRSKDDSTHNRRMVFSYLQNKEAVSELFREISKKISDRPGGYTRILKTGNRLGDNADMCIIELVDYNVAMLEAKETPKAKPTRRRRSAGKKKEEPVTPVPEKPKAEPEVKEPKTKAKKAVKKEAAEEVTETQEVVDQAESTEPQETEEESPETKPV
jgi:large subunit ribosomal protein L17